VTLFTIVNQSNRRVSVSRRRGGTRRYKVEPGETTEYEVDYDEESRNYIRGEEQGGELANIFTLEIKGDKIPS
jgi:hypothetical protein